MVPLNAPQLFQVFFSETVHVQSTCRLSSCFYFNFFFLHNIKTPKSLLQWAVCVSTIIFTLNDNLQTISLHIFSSLNHCKWFTPPMCTMQATQNPQRPLLFIRLVYCMQMNIFQSSLITDSANESQVKKHVLVRTGQSNVDK